LEWRHHVHRGGLGVQGNGDGYFVAYDASTGEELWKVNTYTSTIAPPITYAIDGVQYVAIQVGSGGAGGLTDGSAMPASNKWGNFGRPFGVYAKWRRVD
jgi:glucose dehydrogenase